MVKFTELSVGGVDISCRFVSGLVVLGNRYVSGQSAHLDII